MAASREELDARAEGDSSSTPAASQPGASEDVDARLEPLYELVVSMGFPASYAYYGATVLGLEDPEALVGWLLVQDPVQVDAAIAAHEAQQRKLQMDAQAATRAAAGGDGGVETEETAAGQEDEDGFWSQPEHELRSHVTALSLSPQGARHKMVLVVRLDLQMGKGKIAAQCAHAALGCFQQVLGSNPDSLFPWNTSGQAKVVLRAPDLSTLERLQQRARKVGLPTYQVHDAGRTQVAAGSATVLAIGPGSEAVVDLVTGHLKLL